MNSRRNAQRLRSRETSAGAVLWQSLRNRKLAGWKFRRQHPVDRYVVDFVTLEARLVVEVDGATHGSTEVKQRDTGRTLVLEALGFRVVRVSSRDVYDNPAGVLEMLLGELKTASG